MTKTKSEKTNTITALKNLIPALLAMFLLLGIYSCTDNKGVYQKPEDAMDAGREFLRAALDGDYKKAELYILHDEENDRLFDRFQNAYQNVSAEEKEAYRHASIIVNSTLPQGDSVLIMNCANSYKKRNFDMKVVRYEGEWWVDFKYTFSGNLPLE
jgi:hypothetical protein